MKILFFIGEFSEGGAERVISILANNLVKRDFDIEILKYYNSVNFYQTDERIKITSVEDNTKTTNKIVNLIWVRNYFKNSADIIISFLAIFNMYTLVANMGNNTPVIVADRNDPRFIPSKRLLRFVRNQLYKLASAVIVQTNHNKEYFGYLKNNCFVISNPVNIGNDIGKAINTKKENIIVSVGRLEPQKNQLMLINAFNEIKDKYNDLKLVIYGEGPYRQELEKRIKELNLSNGVLLPGNEKDVFNKISTAKLFVLSSNYEGMPNALMEAMCLGLPCISTKVSGATDLIVNNENGVLIDINDKDELKESMISILDSETFSNKLANNATKVAEQLDCETICNKWNEVINTIVK